jgi:hypothetical protein
VAVVAWVGSCPVVGAVEQVGLAPAVVAAVAQAREVLAVEGVAAQAGETPAVVAAVAQAREVPVVEVAARAGTAPEAAVAVGSVPH